VDCNLGTFSISSLVVCRNSKANEKVSNQVL